MTIFWVISGFLITGALFFIIPPLLQRYAARTGVQRDVVNVSIFQDQFAELEADLRNGVINQEQYEQSHSELERRMLEDVSATPADTSGNVAKADGRWAAVVVGIALPVCAVLLYLKLGSPDIMAPEAASPPAQAAGDPGHVDQQQIKKMVSDLAERLKKNPNDGPGWVMLGRSFTVLGRFQEAEEAYGKATALIPNDAQVWADYADLKALVNGRRLAGPPMELVKKALELDPNNQKALALAGSAAFEVKNYGEAVAFWQQLLQTVPSGSPVAKQISAGIAEAQALAGGKLPMVAMADAGGESGAAAGQGGAASGGASVSGEVSLSPALAAKVAPGDSLFIFARATNGPKMPLAILRLQAKDLPAKFSLDDSMAVMPAMRLSNFPEVIVGAKISKSGSATPQSGDLQGLSAVVKVGSNGVKVVIDKVAP
jgi:cytochrome c-type biogenesis protein CcmH